MPGQMRMAEEIRFLPEILARVAARGTERFDDAMKAIALKIEAEMKKKSREGGAHPYGTKTNARPGSGPGVISGDLSRSIMHEKTHEGYKIGPADIPHTNYASRSGRANARQTRLRAPRSTGRSANSGQIGEWLEKGTGKMPAYPFVGPALDAVKGEIEAMVKAEFEGPM
jgi:hypothetical protein